MCSTSVFTRKQFLSFALHIVLQGGCSMMLQGGCSMMLQGGCSMLCYKAAAA